MSASPSGEQHEISQGDQRAVIVEVGGGLRTYDTAAGPVLDGYGPQERCDGGRGQPLMPWPNRLRDGRYVFEGAEQQLALTEVATATAIHGLVRWANWRVAERGADHLTMALRLHPQPGWPATLDLAIAYALGDTGLTVTTTVVNVGSEPCPFGAGFHPYLGLGVGRVDTMRLCVPADMRLESDARGLPTARSRTSGTPWDFRVPTTIGTVELDTCFTELQRDADGLARVTVEAGTRGAELWLDRAFGYVMVFTGDTLAADRRRLGLALEPMTCPPDALRSGEALLRLDPGARFEGAWGITPR